MVWNLAYARQEVALVFAHKIQGHLLGHFSHLGKEEVAVQKDKHWVSEERPPMFPPSLEWAQTASMVVCARSKDSEICLCLQLVSNSRREIDSHSYSSPCRVVQTLLNLHCSPSSPNLRPVLITNKQSGS